MSSRTNNTSRSSATTSSGSTRQTNNTSRTNNTGRTNNARPTFDRFQRMRELKPRLEDKSKNVNFYRDLVDVLKYAGYSDDHLQRHINKRLERSHNKLKEGIKKSIKYVTDGANKALQNLDDRVRKLEGRPSRATSQAAFTLAGLDSSNSTSGSSTSGSSTTTSSGTKRRRTGGKKKRKSRRKTRRKIRKTKRKKKRSKSKTRRRR